MMFHHNSHQYVYFSAFKFTPLLKKLFQNSNTVPYNRTTNNKTHPVSRTQFREAFKRDGIEIFLNENEYFTKFSKPVSFLSMNNK